MIKISTILEQRQNRIKAEHKAQVLKTECVKNTIWTQNLLRRMAINDPQNEEIWQAINKLEEFKKKLKEL